MTGFKNMDKFDFFFIIEGDNYGVFFRSASENDLFINEFLKPRINKKMSSKANKKNRANPALS